MRRYLLWTGAVVVVIAVVIGLVLVFSPSARQLEHRFGGGGDGPPAAEPIAGADLSGSGPGSLISAMTMPEFSRASHGVGIQAARVVYRSTNGDTGEATEVSGSVFTPEGPPPPGGWPIVAFGHGTTGLDQPCAPSLSGSLLGMSNWVDQLVAAGFAVAFADYQGLGTPGVHPYLDAKTAGLNIVDSVRALRHTFSNTSNRWGALGGSQGGGAVWAADEQAVTYAPELVPVGTVALAPAADVAGLVDKAQAGTLTKEQRAAYLLVIESLARVHPDVNRDDYRRGVAAKEWDVLTACSGELVHDREAAIDAMGPDDLQANTPDAADKIRNYLTAWALPQQRPSAPLSVVYGSKDEYVDASWTTAAIARACGLGATVVWDLQPDKGHGDIDPSAQLAWLAGRFEGKPSLDMCPSGS